MPAPTLRTERLILRGHTRADFAACCALWAHPEVVRYITGHPSPPEEVWARIMRYVGHWELLGFGYWLVTDARSGAVMGEAGLANHLRKCEPPLGDTPEAGWVVLPQYQGHGYTREAVSAVLDWARAQGLGRTVCLIDPANTASLRLAEILGYREYARTLLKGSPAIMLERA